MTLTSLCRGGAMVIVTAASLVTASLPAAADDHPTLNRVVTVGSVDGLNANPVEHVTSVLPLDGEAASAFGRAFQQVQSEAVRHMISEPVDERVASTVGMVVPVQGTLATERPGTRSFAAMGENVLVTDVYVQTDATTAVHTLVPLNRGAAQQPRRLLTVDTVSRMGSIVVSTVGKGAPASDSLRSAVHQLSRFAPVTAEALLLVPALEPSMSDAGNDPVEDALYTAGVGVATAGVVITLAGCVGGPPGCVAGATLATALIGIAGIALGGIHLAWSLFKENAYGCRALARMEPEPFPGEPAGTSGYSHADVVCKRPVPTISMVAKFYQDGSVWDTDSVSCSNTTTCHQTWATSGLTYGRCYWFTLEWTAFVPGGAQSGTETSGRARPDSSGAWHYC